MKRRTLALLLALALLCAALPMQAAAKSFSDVPDTWYTQAVDYVSDQGLFQGTSSTEFSPDVAMDRGMFVSVLSRLADIDPTQYGVSYFYDVKETAYYSPAVQWAASYEIVSGTGNYNFSPTMPAQRQQIAAFMYRFAQATGNDLTVDENALDDFSDAGSVAGYARTAMAWAVTHKVLSGNDGKLMPSHSATRAQVAQIFYNCRDLFTAGTTPVTEPITLEKPPVKPVETFVAPVAYNKTVSGVYTRVVEVDPQKGYNVRPVLALDRLDKDEAASGIVSRTGAVLAVNGAYFQSYDASADDYLNTFSTLIRDGLPLRLENPYAPYKPAFVIDSEGKASIRHFKVRQSVTLLQDGVEKGVLNDINTNIDVSSGSARMIYTREYGQVVPGSIAKGIEVNSQGIVTKVYSSKTENAPIPADGYILFEREVRFVGEPIFGDVKVGDELKRTIQYTDGKNNPLPDQDVVTSLSCGPTVVKDGKAYGNRTTYQQEGFTLPSIIDGSSARMAIGVKSNGTVVIAQATCSLPMLSNVMLELGCKDAMNLDGGASCALYLNGKAIVPAGRNMSNMLVFTKK